MSMVQQIHYPLIRTIYLYLFTLVGLTLLIIGTVRFLDMGLKAFIFTQAEEQQRLYEKQPPVPFALEKVEQIAKDQTSVTLSQEEKSALKQWLIDYQNWQEQSAKIDPITSQRHRDASINLSMILIGLPLYFYHWRLIRKETKNK